MACISGVDFGRVDAEFEENLAEYYVDTGVIGRIKLGRRWLVLGRKGSGKTALFRVLDEPRLGRSIRRLSFEEYPWQLHRLIAMDGVLGETAYTASWRFMMLVEMTKHLTVYCEAEARKRGNALLAEIYGPEEQPDFFSSLIDKARRIRRIDLPGVNGLFSMGGFELEDAKSVGPLLASSVHDWSQRLLEFVKEHFSRHPLTLTMDRLDDGWDATESSRGMLAGVLKAARDINLNLGQRGWSAPVVVFLRSDIFDELNFNDKNKLSADTERLEWADNALVDVVEARIGHSLSLPKKGSWETVFSDAEMRQRASIKSYLIKRCMGRPRDIVAFCIECQNVSQNRGHDRVETDDVYEAEKVYSRHIFDEMLDEAHKQIPQFKDYLLAVREVGRTKFTLESWASVAIRRGLADSRGKSRDILQILFDYSVVGVLRRGGRADGRAGGSKYQFIYSDRLVEPDFEGEVSVHPALKKELALVEPRRDRNSEGLADGGEDEADEE